MARLRRKTRESYLSSIVIGIMLVIVGLIVVDIQLPSISMEIIKFVGIVIIGFGIFSIVKKFF